MLRWLALLLLLLDALVLLWYAQQRPPAQPTPASEQISRLRLLHELGGGETLPLRARECFLIGPFASSTEAETAQRWLLQRGFDSVAEPAPPALLGYHLRLPRPAEPEARLALLDRLALAGWVPQTRDGDFVLGPFLGEQARQQARAEQQAIAEVLSLPLQLEPLHDTTPRLQLRVTAAEGADNAGRLQALAGAGWPGIKIEKKSCEGVAHPESDQ